MIRKATKDFSRWPVLFATMILLSLSLGAMVGCSGKEATKKQSLVYRLKWLYNAGAVGELYALAHGIFPRYGLDVTIEAGGPEHDVINELELGNCQFGVASADQVIRARSKGAHVVVLGQIFQANPLQWIYRQAEITINSPQDLKGKRIAVTYGGNDEAILTSLLAAQNLSSSELTITGARRDFTPFLEGRVHLWPTYRNVEGVAIATKLEGAGEKIGFFDPGQFGIRFVANSVITSEEYYRQNRATADQLVQAVMEGWQAAVDPANEDKAVDAVLRFEATNEAAIVAKQIAASRYLVQPSPNFPVGRIDRTAWRQTEEIMVQLGLIPRPVGIEKFLMPVGTN